MVPPRSDPRWKAFVQGGVEYEFQVLATRILYNRVKALARRRTEESILEAVAVCHGYFVKNESLAAADLRLIFG